jgi:gluconolactonase
MMIRANGFRGAACVLVLVSAWLGAAEQEVTTPFILGVVNAGTTVELVREGFEAVEGPLPQMDDGLLFSNNRVNRIQRLAPDGTISVWYEGAGAANALTRTREGDIVATLAEGKAIAMVQPGRPPQVLVDAYEGTPLNRPNDLVADSRGNIYFTDTISPTATTPAVMPSAVYHLDEARVLHRVAEDIARPNGVALSPDERTLYVANTAGEWVYAFELNRSGKVKERREFAKLAMPPPAAPQNGASAAPPSSGADGMAVDEKGRLYVATTLGVQVFTPEGNAMGIITLPKQPQNLAFSGPGRSTLFVVGRGAVYRIATLTRGPQRSGK